MPQTILILGASSGMARALAHELGSAGHKLVLAGRDGEDLDRSAADLHIRYGVEAQALHFDATDFAGHPGFFAQCLEHCPAGLDGLVLAYGMLGDQAEAERNLVLARQMIEVNYVSAVSILTLAAEYMEGRKQGWLCVIGSVAGDRGRPSNFLYGSTKAALAAYLQGLRARLFKSGVAVITVKPGVVDTAMTWGRPKLQLPAQPRRVGRDIDRAIRRRRNVIYTPWFWRPIMFMVRNLPEPIFKRMNW